MTFKLFLSLPLFSSWYHRSTDVGLFPTLDSFSRLWGHHTHHTSSEAAPDVANNSTSVIGHLFDDSRLTNLICPSLQARQSSYSVHIRLLCFWRNVSQPQRSWQKWFASQSVTGWEPITMLMTKIARLLNTMVSLYFCRSTSAQGPKEVARMGHGWRQRVEYYALRFRSARISIHARINSVQIAIGPGFMCDVVIVP